MSNISIRRANVEDQPSIFRVFIKSIHDLSHRSGYEEEPTIDDEVISRVWPQWESVYNHLTRTAEQFWVAEDDSEIVGFARTIKRDGVRELTEFFVLPGVQSAGIGKQLLHRAFPAEDADARCIIATTDLPAQARYLKAGLSSRFPIYTFSRPAEYAPILSDLRAEAITLDDLPLLADIDLHVLGHSRDIDHEWLINDRPGFIYYRGNRPVGYGYVGKRIGPFAVYDEEVLPMVLAHAETTVAELGHDTFKVEVPLVNREAVQYLLARGATMDPFCCYMMMDRPFGNFSNYIFTSPLLIL